jgi:hypothetical protein
MHGTNKTKLVCASLSVEKQGNNLWKSKPCAKRLKPVSKEKSKGETDPMSALLAMSYN